MVSNHQKTTKVLRWTIFKKNNLNYLRKKYEKLNKQTLSKKYNSLRKLTKF